MQDSLDEKLWDFIHSNSDAIAEYLMKSQRLSGLSECAEDLAENLKTMQQENEHLRKRLAIAEGTIIRSEKKISILEAKIVDLTSRSMKENVILKGMKEEEQENSETLEAKVMSFFQKDLSIPQREMAHITVERIHRIGKFMKGKTRNVIVKLNGKGKGIVMKYIKNLPKTSSIKLSQQLPPEVHSNRNKLWPEYLQAKEQGKRVTWNLDELIVDGHARKAKLDKNNDINKDTTEAALKLKVTHTSIESQGGSHFQGHLVQITSQDDVIPAMKAVGADIRISGANHIMYAYRIGNETHSVQNWEDDGEFGGGRTIMDVIHNKHIFTQLICVTRWYGARTMGQDRFSCIKNIAEKSVDRLVQ